MEDANLKEAIGINQSLTCLGRAIDYLVEQKPDTPYRDSVLTCLLAYSPGDNCRTMMVALLSLVWEPPNLPLRQLASLNNRLPSLDAGASRRTTA